MNRFRPYQDRLFRIAAEKKLWMRPLGEIDGKQVWFLRNRESRNSKGITLLIVAGFHGEEQAGPLGLLEWLEEFDMNLYSHFNLSFVPIINPVGFDYKRRYADPKVKNNCGFCHPESGDQPSKEGIILLKNFPLLKGSARDGFLSLHEDVFDPAKDRKPQDKYYVYTFERTPEPGGFTLGLLEKLGEFFPGPLDDEYVETDTKGGDVKAKRGIIYRLCDGSFEDYLFHEGILRCAVTETPGKYPLKKRVLANKSIISRFIEISGGGEK
jgi:hypothetical protein